MELHLAHATSLLKQLSITTTLQRSGISLGKNTVFSRQSLKLAGTMAQALSATHSKATPAPSPQPMENGKTGSILELSEHLRSIGKELPKDLTVTETQRSTIGHDEWKDLAEIPVIDLSLLETDRAGVVKQIHAAVTEWGFFQILNHGLPLEVLKGIRAQGMKFFELPLEIKNKAALSENGGPGPYSSNCSKRSFSSLLWAESVAIYSETWENLFIHKIWPEGNEELRDTVTRFSSGSELIAKQLFELIAESLGLPTNFLSQHYDENRVQVVRWNYYPPCPRPSDSMGATSHTDPNCLTVLLQDNVGGLQVEKDGQWVGIKPIEGALVVNIGDTVHAWTNAICKSVLHRVVVNKAVPRLSIASFVNVGDIPIYPPVQLIDENHPRQYKAITPVGHLKNMVQYKSEDKSTGRDGVAFLKERFKFEKDHSAGNEEAEKLETVSIIKDVF